MKRIIKKIISAAINIPVSIIRARRNYVSLSESLAVNRPKVLIIACHWIGDTLWAAQVVPHLRERFPEAFLCALTKPVCTPLWSGVLSVDKVIESKFVVSDRRRENNNWHNLRQLGRELAQEKWDLIIDLTANRYSAVLCHLVNARHTLGFDGGEFAALYATNVKNAERNDQHLSERPFRVIEPLMNNFVYDGKIIPPKAPGNFATACKRYGFDSTRKLAVIAPSAGWSKKEWGDENFSALIEKLLEHDIEVALIDSLSNVDRLRHIKSSVDDVNGAIKIVAEPSIDSALALIEGCSFFVGNDSGLGHLAGALGRQTISIFTGETVPSFCGPLGIKVHVVNENHKESSPPFIASLMDNCLR